MWIEKIDAMIADGYAAVVGSETDLCRIMNSHGSDKGNGHHNYSRFYHSLFSFIRNDDIYIFELGLGTNNTTIPSNMGSGGKPGASLRGWQDYFPNAKVRGADVDPDIVNGPNDTDRIKTLWVDQTNKQAVLNMWGNPVMNHKYKVIIDDGLHEYRGNISFFENSIDRLEHDGVFVIEDILPHQVNDFRSYFDRYCKDGTFEYRIVDLPLETNKADNRLVVVSR